MSLDLTLKCAHGGHEIKSFNYTYNVSPMWYAIFPGDDGMVAIDEMTGARSLLKLDHAIEMLKADPAKFIAMNPPNGWGDYHSFLSWLESVRDAAKASPEGVWESWR